MQCVLLSTVMWYTFSQKLNFSDEIILNLEREFIVMGNSSHNDPVHPTVVVTLKGNA